MSFALSHTHPKVSGRVLHVAMLPPPIGGMTTYFKGLIESRVSEEFKPLIVRSDAVNKFRCRGFNRVVMNLLNVPVLAGTVIISLIRYRPVIVHIQSNSGAGYYEKTLIAMLSRLFSCIVLMHMHGGGFRNYYQRSTRIMRWFIRRCIALNHYIIAPSQAMRDTFLLIGVSPERVKLLENAVQVPDESVWDHRRNDQEGDGLTRDVTVLFFNSTTRAKGIFEFVEAASHICRELPNVNFRIAGLESPDSVLVRKQIKDSCAPDRIQFIGSVSEEEKDAELRKADIYVLPSYIEDLPYGLLDAMALGLPCIATAVGGVPSLIEDGSTGLLIRPRDAAMLAEALRRFIANPQLRRNLGAAGRQLILEQYSWQRRAEEIAEFYRAVLRDAPELLPITLS